MRQAKALLWLWVWTRIVVQAARAIPPGQTKQRQWQRSTPWALRGGASLAQRDKLALAMMAPFNNYDDTTQSSISLPVDPSAISISDLVQQLQTNLETGLSHHQASQRLEQFGKNVLTSPHTLTFWELWARQLDGPWAQMSVASFFASAVISNRDLVGGNRYKLTMAALLVTALVTCFLTGIGAAIAWSQQALEALQSTKSTVLRENGNMETVDATTLVPGDVILVRAGDKIPADGRVVQYSQAGRLHVDESGGSVVVSKLVKNENSPLDSVVQNQMGMVFFGGTSSVVMAGGSALVLVTATGRDTQFAKMQAAETEAAKKQLDFLGNLFALLFGLVWFAWLFGSGV